jgi:hypothetical protein
MTTEDSRPPWRSRRGAACDDLWDDDDADWLIGKYVLVGVTYLASDGETVTSQVQYHGRITKAAQAEGITIACEGTSAEKSLVLPPDLAVFTLARPGEYKLRSTGEVVHNPDMLASWTVTAAAKPS